MTGRPRLSLEATLSPPFSALFSTAAPLGCGRLTAADFTLLFSSLTCRIQGDSAAETAAATEPSYSSPQEPGRSQGTAGIKLWTQSTQASQANLPQVLMFLTKLHSSRL